MSKLYFCLVLLTAFYFAQSHSVQRREVQNEEVVLNSLTPDQMDELERKVYEECALKLNICKCHIEKYYRNDTGVPDSVEFKKIAGCYGEKMGYVSGTKPNWERIRESYEVYYKDNKEDLETALKIVNECQKLPLDNMDGNEVNYALAKCTKEGYLKSDLEW
ncbi:uncharacterized protein [Rhodnius prolixus]|uniref:uncharacterized protein n=1 Tax=Rhodnius prolixus TaxID=13249 RepID=UPI003D18B4E6